VVHCLLGSRVVDINTPMKDGATPFYIACQNGHVDVVRSLLRDPRTHVSRPRNDGATPLFIGCQKGHLDIVRLLISDPRVTDLNTSMDVGISPFSVSCGQGNSMVAKLLIASGLPLDIYYPIDKDHLLKSATIIDDWKHMVQAIPGSNIVARQLAEHQGFTSLGELIDSFEMDPVLTRQKARVELGLAGEFMFGSCFQLFFAH